MAAITAHVIRTDIPARLDRLPWSRWHWRVVIALGITWIIDGLEATLIGAISPVLLREESLHFRTDELGLLTTWYLVGAVLGALVFGYLTDRLGRKKLFTVTLGLYLVSAFLTAFSWNFWSFAVFRFFTGAGIGGEYSAINSAIDELIPARVRGWVDLAINGTFWLGCALGAFASLLMLDRRLIPLDLGWRVGFGIGAMLGLVIIFFRKDIPESPRWLMTHGRVGEAERVVADIERSIERRPGAAKLPAVDRTVAIKPYAPIGFGTIARTMVEKYPRRAVLGLALVTSQAFLYNGMTPMFATILTKYFGVADDRAGLYLVPFALGNFLGPLLLGSLFDSWGRKPMIAGTYTVSAVLLVVTGYLFAQGHLTSTSQTLLWALIFAFASAAASAAYLTVSEIFPLEVRGLSIALFYSVGTAVGGWVAPWMFGRLIATGERASLFHGYVVTAVILLATVVVVALFGVKAERASLEDLAEPLSFAGDEPDAATSPA
jgi:MFS family permease